MNNIVHFLLILCCHSSKVLSHWPSKGFTEQPSSDNIISSRILNSFKEDPDEAQDTLDSPSPNFETIENENPQLETILGSGSEKLESAQFINPYRNQFPIILEPFLDSELHRDETKSRVTFTSPSNAKFSVLQNGRGAFGRGETYSEKMQNLMSLEESYNTRVTSPSVKIPIVQDQKYFKGKTVKKSRDKDYHFQGKPRYPSSQMPSTPFEERLHYWPRPNVAQEYPEYASSDLQSTSHGVKTQKHGVRGDYSWTVEKVSPEQLEMEAILPPVAEIYKAISEAEKDEEIRQKFQMDSLKKYLQKLQDQYKHGGNIQIDTLDLQNNSKGWPNPHVGSPSAHIYNSRPPKVNREHSHSSHGNEYEEHKHGSEYGGHGHGHEYGGHGNEYGGHGYGHGSEFGGHGHGIHWGPIDGWMTKAKTFIYHISNGSHSHSKITRTILEVSIWILALLAFGAYLAALFFQSLIPSLAYPLIPGIINVNNTNPGLLGLLFGRNLDGGTSLYVLKNTTVGELEARVQMALNETNFPLNNITFYRM